jgi:hypothetical protein
MYSCKCPVYKYLDRVGQNVTSIDSILRIIIIPLSRLVAMILTINYYREGGSNVISEINTRVRMILKICQNIL